jgi:hypothetical protein
MSSLYFKIPVLLYQYQLMNVYLMNLILKLNVPVVYLIFKPLSLLNIQPIFFVSFPLWVPFWLSQRLCLARTKILWTTHVKLLLTFVPLNLVCHFLKGIYHNYTTQVPSFGSSLTQCRCSCAVHPFILVLLSRLSCAYQCQYKNTCKFKNILHSSVCWCCLKVPNTKW